MSLLRAASRHLSGLFGSNRAVILKYHRVLPEQDPMRPGEITAAEFEAQMRVVSSGFRSMTFGAWLDERRSARIDNTVVVTFDDGYKDNHDIALPILRKLGVAATFFVASGYVAGGMMWNDRLIEALRAAVGRTIDLEATGLGRVTIPTLAEASRIATLVLSAIKRWPQDARASFVDRLAGESGSESERVMMNATEVRALADAGFEIGAHTVTHPILSKLSPEDAWTEIRTSKEALEQILAREIRVFAYPNGRPGKDFTDADVQRVKQAGFIGAVTTQWGCATPQADDFLVPRQGIWGTSKPKLWSQLIRNFRA
jgi:peptidoglycan/xylan/chitin deacetylase (PgdA/CDA1 family)